MALIGSIEAFNTKESDFQSYIERLEQLFICNGVDEDKTLPMFLTPIGGEAHRVLKDILAPVTISGRLFRELKRALVEHHYPKWLLIARRFYNVHQSPDDSGWKKNRSCRMTKVQKEHFIQYLETHKFMIETKINPSDLPKLKLCWENLTVELNNLSSAQKNVKEWKYALNEMKVNARRKARLLHNEGTGTGGGPKVEKGLTPLEERLLALLSRVVITGLPGVTEVGAQPLENTDVVEAIEIIIENEEEPTESTAGTLSPNIINDTPNGSYSRPISRNTSSNIKDANDVNKKRCACLRDSIITPPRRLMRKRQRLETSTEAIILPKLHGA